MVTVARVILRGVLVALLWGLSVSSARAASAVMALRVDLPGHGSILISLPDGWHNVIGRGGDKDPPQITLWAENREQFKALLVPRWDLTGRDANYNSRERMRALVQKVADGVKPQAVESELPLSQLTGDGIDGYYFSATAKAPKSGEYQHLIAGSVALGDLAVGFSIVNNAGAEAEARQGLEVLRSLQRLTR
jgi:hypothetical protein